MEARKLEESWEETSLLGSQNNEMKGFSLKSKVAGGLFTAAVLFSGAAVLNNKSVVSSPNSELLVGNQEAIVKHSLLVQRKGYEPISEHTLGVYSMDNVVEPDTITIMTVTTCSECTDLIWDVEPIEAYGSVDYDATLTSNTLQATFSSANSHYNVKVTKGTTQEVILDVVVTCKYVRRELRSINEEDRKKFFKALQVMYSTSQEEGTQVYGEKYLSYSHLSALHNSQDYNYHGNLFFLTSHPVMQMKFEKSLLAIDKSVPLNYWDFLIDHKLGRNWADSEIYSIDMFGPVKTSPNDNYRPRGYFFNVKLVMDIDNREFPRSGHTPHGTLGSSLSTTDSAYLQRSNSYCGFESIQGQVSCNNLVTCFSTFESEHNLRQFDECMELDVHANLHYMHAGQWECQVSWSEFYEEHKLWLDETLFSIIATRMSSESLDHQVDYVDCPTTCAYGEDCDCISILQGVHSIEDVHLVSKTRKFGILKDTWEIMATVSYGGHEFIKFQETFVFDGVTHHNVFVPIHSKAGQIGEPLDEDQLDVLNTLMLKTILFPGSIGVMLSGAAPTDPLFWVMHPLFDKALHALRLSPRYNSEGFVWNNNAGDMKFDGITPFTRLDFEPYMTKVENPKLYMTNEEVWDNIHPSAESVYYIYDQFTNWGECTFDPFGTSDDV